MKDEGRAIKDDKAGSGVATARRLRPKAHYIRWSYVAPRLAGVTVAIALAWLVINPLLRWSLTSLGESLTAAKVEIGSLKTSLVQGEICLSDVQAANRESPMKNLFEAREVSLSLEPGPLARKKLIIRAGRLSGLRWDTDRSTSGALDPNMHFFPLLPAIPPIPGGEAIELAEKDVAKLAGALLDQLADLLGHEVDKQIEQLQTVRVAQELMARWPRQYEQLEGRADMLRKHIDTLRADLQTSSNDLPQNLQTCRRAASELEQIDGELRQMRTELEQLPQQALRDRQTVVVAAGQDFEHIQQALHVDNLNADSLSEYLLGHELGEAVITVARWIQWGRQCLPVQTAGPAPVRGRGIDIPFPRPQQPDFLIRALALDGEGQLAGQHVQFLATLAGLTTQPELYGRPAVLKADVKIPLAMHLEVVADRSGAQPYDRITLDCSCIPQPQRVLGRADQLAVSVSPGNTHVSATIELKGEQLSGRVTVRQEPVQLVLQLAAACGGSALAAPLQTAASQIRTVDAAVILSGTLQKPDWAVQCSLGQQLVAAFNGAIQHELETRRDQLVATAKQQIDAQFVSFDQMVMSKQDALLAKLQLGTDAMNQLSQSVAQRIPLPTQGLPSQILPGQLVPNTTLPNPLLGRDLPATVPLRY
jgi:uncharacterized protein (TIGR03545 family)